MSFEVELVTSPSGRLRHGPIPWDTEAFGFPATRLVLARALAAAGDEKPLGQSLVSMGLISATELQAALAYKMGYPMVDLMRFVVDPAAAARLPWQVAERYRILPLMMEGERLVVAIDSPSREADLRAMAFYAPGGLAPVLAPGYQIALALRSNDLWTGAVRDHPASVRTTG